MFHLVQPANRLQHCCIHSCVAPSDEYFGKLATNHSNDLWIIGDVGVDELACGVIQGRSKVTWAPAVIQAGALNQNDYQCT